MFLAPGLSLAGVHFQWGTFFCVKLLQLLSSKRAGNRGSISGFPHEKYAFSSFPWLFFPIFPGFVA